MTDHKYTNILGKTVFDVNNKINCGLLLEKPVPELRLSLFLLFIFVFCILLLLENSTLKTCDESTLWVELFCSAAEHILPSPRLKTY